MESKAAINWAANYRKKVGMLQSISFGTEPKRLENPHSSIKVITRGNEDRHVTTSN
jgi:hypothetical protein